MASPAFAFKEYSQILSSLIAWVVANQTRITDFNPSSLAYQLLAALANEIARLYLEARAGFDLQLSLLANSVFGLSRIGALAATGTVSFTSASPAASQIFIPSGSLLSSSAGVQYTTTQDASIAAGGTHVSGVPIQATQAGASGNIPVGTSLTLVSNIPGISTATLDAGIVNGLDAETLEAYNERFQLYLTGLGRCTPPGLKAMALGIQGVRSVSLEEFFPPVFLTYQDPVTLLSVQNFVNAILYVESGSGFASSQVLSAVQAGIDGTDGNGGARSGGIRIIAQAPTVVPLAVTGVVTRSNLFSQDALLTLLQGVITGYVNALGLGKPLVLKQLEKVIMNVAGITDVALSSPAANITVSQNQIIRIAQINLSFQVAP